MRMRCRRPVRFLHRYLLLKLRLRLGSERVLERTETLVTSSEKWSREGDREDADAEVDVDVGIGVGVCVDVGVCVCVEIMAEERTKRHETGEKKKGEEKRVMTGY